MGGDESYEALESRLRDLGRAPVDPALADTHLATLAAASAGAAAQASERRWRFGWKAVAAAGMVGFLAGSTGLAAAGSLPAPAQDVAHNVLGAVGLDVPRSTDGCPEGRSYRNHGEYVSEVANAGGDSEAAARSECGMPVTPGRGGGVPGRPDGFPGPASRPDIDGDPCTGPPPWAGAGLTREERQALQEQHRQACGDPEAEGVEEQQEAEAERQEAILEEQEQQAEATEDADVAPEVEEVPDSEADGEQVPPVDPPVPPVTDSTPTTG